MRRFVTVATSYRRDYVLLTNWEGPVTAGETDREQGPDWHPPVRSVTGAAETPSEATGEYRRQSGGGWKSRHSH